MGNEKPVKDRERERKAKGSERSKGDREKRQDG